MIQGNTENVNFQHKKLLYSFEAGDYFYLGIIEDTIETKRRLIKCVNNLLEMKEIENYVIYNGEDKELCVNLLQYKQGV